MNTIGNKKFLHALGLELVPVLLADPEIAPTAGAQQWLCPICPGPFFRKGTANASACINI